MHKITPDLLPLAIPINSIKPDPANPRTGHDVDGIAKSLNDYGQCEAIVVNRLTRKIEAGHGRLYAAQKLGWSEIAANFVDHTPDQATGYNIAANLLSDKSKFDDEILLTLLQSLDNPLEVPGIDDAFMAELLEAVGGDLGGDGEGDDLIEDDVPIDKAEELLEKWQCEAGQLWTFDGKHRLIVGDCTDKATVERLMGGEQGDLTLTDPPYGVSYADKNKFLNEIDEGNRIQSEIENDHMSIDDIKPLWLGAFTHAHDNATDKASFYSFMPQGGDQMMMMMMMISEAGWMPKHELIWLKNNHVLGRADYAYKHEPILYGWKRNGTHKYYGGFQTSIFEFDKPLKSEFHPTMKPIALVAKLIENSTIANMIVYDPFLGSGTTMIATHQVGGGRKCYGCEIEPKYAAVICERMSLLGLTPELSKE